MTGPGEPRSNEARTCSWCAQSSSGHALDYEGRRSASTLGGRLPSCGRDGHGLSFIPTGERDWTRPTAAMSDMLCRSGVTLRHACASLGRPLSGTKRHLAGRLLDVGLTATEVEDRYGWHARRGASR